MDCKKAYSLAAFVICVCMAACSGGGGDGSPAPAPTPLLSPTLSSVSFTPAQGVPGSTLTVNGSFSFQDPQGDLDGGTINYTYGGNDYSATLPGSFAGQTSGTGNFSAGMTLDSTIGIMRIPVWLVDKAGHASNTVYVTFAQVPAAATLDSFAKTYSETGTDNPYVIRQTNDGGYIVADRIWASGSTTSSVRILKLNGDGAPLWQKNCNNNVFDKVVDIQQTSDGGYVAAGSTGDAGSINSKLWIFKLDSNGVFVWSKKYDYGDSDASSIQQTADGGYIVTGRRTVSSRFVLWILKLDSDGDKTWVRTYDYGGSSSTEGIAVRQTSDNGYIVAANLTAGSDYYIWALKLDANGTTATGWQRNYLAAGQRSRVHSIQPITGGTGGYALVGEIGPSGSPSALILRLNSDGTIAWQNSYTNGLYDNAYAIQLSAGGDFVVGAASAFATGYDFWLFKTSSLNGSILWQNRYGGTSYDRLLDMIATADDHYVMVGQSNSFTADVDPWVLKVTPAGAITFNAPSGAEINTTTAVVAATTLNAAITSIAPTDDFVSTLVSVLSFTPVDFAVTVTIQAP